MTDHTHNIQVFPNPQDGDVLTPEAAREWLRDTLPAAMNALNYLYPIADRVARERCAYVLNDLAHMTETAAECVLSGEPIPMENADEELDRREGIEALARVVAELPDAIDEWNDHTLAGYEYLVGALCKRIAPPPEGGGVLSLVHADA